ncbi:NUDIX hydrolase [Clostridiales bacterium PH28_bin88]|nr:NUDIX hydrolase [Clostridiales bacterium PH28_bin88]
MLFRKCAGGIVFSDDHVFLLQNDKREWVLPKGVVRQDTHPSEVALKRVREETGVRASIIGPAGETSYEFFSVSRQRPVCNQITWFVMQADSTEFHVAQQEGFLDGGFFPVDEAVKRITYSQDKALVRISYRKLQRLLEKGA